MADDWVVARRFSKKDWSCSAVIVATKHCASSARQPTPTQPWPMPGWDESSPATNH